MKGNHFDPDWGWGNQGGNSIDSGNLSGHFFGLILGLFLALLK